MHIFWSYFVFFLLPWYLYVLLFALMVCIVLIVIRMPNDGVCPIQVVTQDADMAENINFNGYIVQNGTKFGAIVAKMKQILGTVAIFHVHKFHEEILNCFIVIERTRNIVIWTDLYPLLFLIPWLFCWVWNIYWQSFPQRWLSPWIPRRSHQF